MYLASIIKTENGVIRTIHFGSDLSRAITKRFDDISSNYFEWEILKEWKLKTV